MIAEAGLALLWIAAALAALQLVFGIIGVAKGDATMAANIKPIATIQGIAAALSFAALIWAFLITDLSVNLVVQNSHSAKPLLFKFAGTWGNHEGSMLLWVTVLAISGAAVALFEKRLSKATLTATLAAQALIGLGFYAFLLLSSNPFARSNPVPVEGLGLNPLLQDPGLAFHPPTLYFGYVGISIAFSFAVGALVTREVDQTFARAMRPWVLIAWIFLTLGIVAGSYWAYYELGWGGWWFWDPVENASLMPWLAATALLHSVTVLATRDGLRAWTIMLAVVAFSMSMVGTFLVRSGILTSVHSFAVDPTRGSFILALLTLYIGGAMALFALRVGTVREGNQFEIFSREGALVANNLLLSSILGIVLVGTLYPLAAEAVTGEKLSVGPPYFNAAAGPVALVLVAIMAAGPLIRWRRDDWRQVIGRLAAPILLTAIALAVTVFMAPGIGILPLLSIVIALGVGAASLAPLWKRNLRRTPLFTYGTVIAHLGIAVAMIGMASEAAFTKETLAAMNVGDTRSVGPYSVTLKGVQPVAGPNWTAIEAVLEVRRGDDVVEERPQARMFSSPPTATNEAAIRTHLDGQIYLVIGEEQPDGRWQLRMWWKPYVTLIWFGGIMVALGGFLALIGRLKREVFSKPKQLAEAAI
jgi:cytochrome c-type biogenesis protein CcmF